MAFRRPSLTFAEIAWRWSIRMSAILLLAVASIDYLDTLPVTNLNADLLATRQPLLVWQALRNIFRGSLNRAVPAALVVVFALLVLWIVVASIGRLAVIRAIIDDFSDTTLGRSYDASARDISSSNISVPAAASPAFATFSSLIALNVVRSVAILSALLALAASSITASLASPQPTVRFLFFSNLAGIVAVSWVGLNWLLSLASIFVVRNRQNAARAILAALSLLSKRPGPVFAVTTWNLLTHFAVSVVAAAAILISLIFISIIPTILVVIGITLIALAYFAIVDWLYIARLAGYICIAEMPEELASPVISPAPPAAGGANQSLPQTAVDRDESILSDLPGMALPPVPQS